MDLKKRAKNIRADLFEGLRVKICDHKVNLTFIVGVEELGQEKHSMYFITAETHLQLRNGFCSVFFLLNIDL